MMEAPRGFEPLLSEQLATDRGIPTAFVLCESGARIVSPCTDASTIWATPPCGGEGRSRTCTVSAFKSDSSASVSALSGHPPLLQRESCCHSPAKM